MNWWKWMNFCEKLTAISFQRKLTQNCHDSMHTLYWPSALLSFVWNTLSKVSYSHPVFGQVVTDHALLPHLLCCFWRRRKLCLLLTVFLFLWQSMDPLVQLRVSTTVLYPRGVIRLMCLPWSMCLICNSEELPMMNKVLQRSRANPTLADGDLVTKGLPAPTLLSLVPPSFSSVRTRSLSSSGRVCSEMNPPKDFTQVA